MSPTAHRLRSHAVSALAIAVSCLAAYNTFGDNAAVKEEAKRVAGCAPSCEIAAEDRNPFRQELSVAKKGGTVTVRCSRALWLVGAYSCVTR